jgi:hypothetical protein
VGNPTLENPNSANSIVDSSIANMSSTPGKDRLFVQIFFRKKASLSKEDFHEH